VAVPEIVEASVYYVGTALLPERAAFGESKAAATSPRIGMLRAALCATRHFLLTNQK